MLHSGLPALGTALARADVDDPAGWTATDHLLAHILDALRAANWQRGGKDPEPPKPWPRPGIAEADAPMSVDELARHKERMSYRFAREE